MRRTSWDSILKVRYHASGEKTIKTLAKSGIVRMRRKLKKFRGMVGRTKLTADDVYASIQSWITHARVASSYHAVKAMLALYDMMYEGYRLTRRYWKRNEDLHRKRKVVRI